MRSVGEVEVRALADDCLARFPGKKEWRRMSSAMLI